MIDRVIYLAVGVVVTVAGWVLDDRRGAQAAALAWLLCALPLLAGPVANALRFRKISVKHNRLAFLAGVVPRMAWTLGGATALYVLATDALGMGFWLAVLVCYLAALLIAARQAIRASEHTRPRDAAGRCL